MSDSYRLQRKPISPSDIDPNKVSSEPASQQEALPNHLQEVIKQNFARPDNPDAQMSPKITGNIPPELKQMIQAKISGEQMSAPDYSAPMTPVPRIQTNDPVLNELLKGLNNQNYEEVYLPSLGRFYDGINAPKDGKVFIRPMVGQDEMILTAPRNAKTNKATEMIFSSCLRDKSINPEALLSVDRTYLFIFLRGISYGNLYEIKVSCEECQHTFDYQVDLNLKVNYCAEDFSDVNLVKTLPTSGYTFKYKLSTGKDEGEINFYNNKINKNTDASNDVFFYRASLLIDWIGKDDNKLVDKSSIKQLLKQLSVNDVNYIRNVLNNPPFGVDTLLSIPCPSCYYENKLELPMGVNFFFPRMPV